MEDFDFDKNDKKEWIELGFYYQYNDELKRWEFTGSKQGLMNFSREINMYTELQNNIGLSEHIHLGPYAYLKIITWDNPIIKKDGFYGSIQDLKELANIFNAKLESTSENDCFKIDKEFSNTNESTLLVCIKKEGFDPSSLD